MAEASSKNLVSLFHPLGNETVKQTRENRNIMRNKCETTPLKALADKVLQRNKLRNKSETNRVNFVSSDKFHETSENNQPFSSPFLDSLNSSRMTGEIKQSPSIPLIQQEDLLYAYNERAAIFEFEGSLTREEAESRSFQETLPAFLADFYPRVLAHYSSTIKEQEKQ